jgi:hypothetical protein
MKYSVYIQDPEHKIVFNDIGDYVAIVNGEFSEEYYKRRIITRLLKYWEKDICATWHNVSFVKHFENMGLVPEGKYTCWEGIHFFLRRNIYIQFFENLTEHILDELYQDLQDKDNILVLREDDEEFEEFKESYGSITGGCQNPGMCHHCEELTHVDNDDYENEDAYSSDEDADTHTACNCKK